MEAATQPRVVTLDILRGVAVIGILAMNALAFAMPDGAYFNPLVYGAETALDRALWLFNFIFVDGKMRGLFSMLFGASMLLVIRAAEARGENPANIHFRRMAWLAVFGAIHLFLIWWGDILLLYAMVGAVAYLFRDKPLKALGIWIAILLTIDQLFFGAIGASFLVVSSQAAQPGANAEIVKQWAEMQRAFGPMEPAKLAEDLARFRGEYGDIVQHRLTKNVWTPIQSFLMFGWETLAYMLMGMAAIRMGFLTGEWAPARYRRIALVGIGLGAAATAALAAWLMRSDFHTAVVMAGGLCATVVPRTLMIVGYAAMIVLLTRNGGALVARIAATGRTAFSNYLGTSLVMTTIFYGYGGGLYGHVSRTDLYILVIALWALMLLWSKPWLERFSYGPLEWLWRSLSRGGMQPMRRQPQVAVAA